MKTKKNLSSRTISLVLAMMMLLSLLPAGFLPAAIAAPGDYGEGEVPIPSQYLEYYSMDTLSYGAAQPVALAPGQIWVGKDALLQNEASGLFEITLYAWGARYDHIEDGQLLESNALPLEALSDEVTVTDVIGEQFVLTAASLAYLAGRSDIQLIYDSVYPARVSEVVWFADQTAIVGAQPVSIHFEVQLDEGWVTDTPYETNESAKAEFSPRKGNPHYWTMQDSRPVYYRVDGVNWNSGQGGRLQQITLIDDAIIVNGSPFTFSLNGNYGNNATFTIPGHTGRVNIDANSPVHNGVTYVYQFTLTVYDLPEPGVSTVYVIYVDNEGGNINDNTQYLKTIVYDDFHIIDSFDWIDDTTVREEIEGTGVIELSLDLTDIEGSKVWVDDGNADDTRPDELVINLYRHLAGQTEADRILVESLTLELDELGDANIWEFLFEDAPIHDIDGITYIYTVDEVVPAGYTKSSQNGNTITNTLSPGSVDVPGSKIWVDDSNADETRPAALVVNLYRHLAGQTEADRAFVESITLELDDLGNANTWPFLFEDLPVYNASGVKYVYTVDEVVPVGYTKGSQQGNTITNALNPGAIDVPGSKIWADDGNADSTRPDELVINLYRYFAGQPETAWAFIESITLELDELGDANTWPFVFEDLPLYNALGVKYLYVVAETVPDGYSMSREGNHITNTLNAGEETILVTKEWIDGDNADETRPAAINYTITGRVDGEVVYSGTATGEADTWGFSLEVPKYDGQKRIVYSVSETQVSGYEAPVVTKESDYRFRVVNVIESEITAISGLKRWVGDEVYHNRPQSIEVILRRDGVELDRRTVSGPEWRFAFEELDVRDNAGRRYVYSVQETPVSGYSTEIHYLGGGSYEIVNTRIPGPVEGTLTVYKVLLDRNGNPIGDTIGNVMEDEDAQALYEAHRDPFHLELRDATAEDAEPVITQKEVYNGESGEDVAVFDVQNWQAAAADGEKLSLAEVELNEEAYELVEILPIHWANGQGVTTVVNRLKGTPDVEEDELRIVKYIVYQGRLISNARVNAQAFEVTVSNLDEAVAGRIDIDVKSIEDAIAEFMSSDPTRIVNEWDGYVVAILYSESEEDVVAWGAADEEAEEGEEARWIRFLDLAPEESYVLKLMLVSGAALEEAEAEGTEPAGEEFYMSELAFSSSSVWMVAFAAAAEEPEESGADPETIFLTAEKIWEDDGDEAGMRPAQLRYTVTGRTGDEEIVFEEELICTAEEGWGFSLEVPVYDGEQLIAYSLTEDPVDGYVSQIGASEDGLTFIVTNTLDTDGFSGFGVRGGLAVPDPDEPGDGDSAEPGEGNPDEPGDGESDEPGDDGADDLDRSDAGQSGGSGRFSDGSGRSGKAGRNGRGQGAAGGIDVLGGIDEQGPDSSADSESSDAEGRDGDGGYSEGESTVTVKNLTVIRYLPIGEYVSGDSSLIDFLREGIEVAASGEPGQANVTKRDKVYPNDEEGVLYKLTSGLYHVEETGGITGDYGFYGMKLGGAAAGMSYENGMDVLVGESGQVVLIFNRWNGRIGGNGDDPDPDPGPGPRPTPDPGPTTTTEDSTITIPDTDPPLAGNPVSEPEAPIDIEEEDPPRGNLPQTGLGKDISGISLIGLGLACMFILFFYKRRENG